jgi:hypothetical protein
MEVGSPEWIEASLAKLDTLERERDQHEAALESANDPLTLKQHNDAVERLDAEIKSLYAQLEAVAGEEEEQEEDDEDDVAPRNTQSDDELSAPHASAEPEPAPAPAPAPAPIAAAVDRPFGGSGGGLDAPLPVSYDDDLKPKGGGAKWAFLGVVVVAGVSVGVYFAWSNMQAQKQKTQGQPDAIEEVKIEAAQIREDTEAPNAAKGGDATVSPTAKGYPTGGGSGGSGGGGGGGGKKADPKKTKPLTIKNSDDPLG